ncbi:hypothetical protein EKD04_015760 [Chloroflexales bacterium ZM16-3]|nr:hypothetical protein [Chloroflexales bacterium ZM16-3]
MYPARLDEDRSPAPYYYRCVVGSHTFGLMALKANPTSRQHSAAASLMRRPAKSISSTALRFRAQTQR